MKRLLTILFIIVMCSHVFADVAWTDVGSLSSDAQASLNVGLLYDPRSMHRMQFGFSSNSHVNWNGAESVIENSYSLSTTYQGTTVVGEGSFNFYWILYTPFEVTARVYMNGPLVDAFTGENLDWSISFDSIDRELSFFGVTLDSIYGPTNSKIIFRKSVSEIPEVVIDSVPFKVKTKSVEGKFGQVYDYTGSINVLIECGN